MQIEARDFNLQATLESGQVFGFTKTEENTYQGVISRAQVTLSQNSHTLHVFTAGTDPLATQN